jgi:outer membrane protein assembly factor BamA
LRWIQPVAQLLLCIVALSAASTNVTAQGISPPDAIHADLPDSASIHPDSAKLQVHDTTDSGTGGVGAPYLKYAPETRIAGGVVGIYFFHLRGDSGATASRPSSVSGGGSYTQKHQFSTGIDYDFYFAHDIYHWSGGFDYKRIPFDFYGVGNTAPNTPTDSYTPLWRGGDFQVTRNFERTTDGEGLNIGVGGQVRSDKILSSNPGGPLQTGNIPGAKGGLSSGLGLVVNYDTRDNIYATWKGEYVAFLAFVYDKLLGSDFNFVRYALDLRKFFPVFGTHTIAVQALLTLANGLEPFYTLAGLGGDVNMRGYYQNRYQANDMFVLQADYRIPIYWRFSGAVFAGMGEVAGTVPQFSLPGFKYSYGAGIRFAVIPDERLNVRLDYGFGSDSQELYFSILEAF